MEQIDLVIIRSEKDDVSFRNDPRGRENIGLQNGALWDSVEEQCSASTTLELRPLCDIMLVHK